MDSVEAHKRDCLARYILDNWTYNKAKLYLSKQNQEFKKDMGERINEQRRVKRRYEK